MAGRLLAVIVLLLSAAPAAAQIDSTGGDDERLRERLFEQGSQDGEESPALDDLDALARSPLNLNEATLEQLQALPFLTPLQAYALYGRREEDGGFESWSDVQSADGMTNDALIYLRVYAYIPARTVTPFWSGSSVELRSRFQQEDEVRRGYLDGSYAGSRLKSYHRVQAQIGSHVGGGVILEKDAGETSFADHVAGYVEARELGPLLRAVAGDYTITAGQGMAFCKSGGFSKGAETVSAPKRRGGSIAPYVSGTESGYLRGAAAELRSGPLSVTGFFSFSSYDATTDTTDGAVGAFDESGYHRTASEINREDAARETLAGARLQTRVESGDLLADIGATAYVSQFSRDVESSTPFGFRGNTAAMAAMDVDAFYRRANLFAEWALARGGAVGGIAGISAELGGGLSATALLRHYPADFVSLHGFAFGERNGATQNEDGLYLGIAWKLARQLVLRAYMDHYRFPGPTYEISVPCSGRDLLAVAEWKPARRLLVSARFKRETKDDEVAALDADGRDIRPVTQRTQQNLRLEAEYETAGHARLRLRFEHSDVQHTAYLPRESGYLFFADVRVPLPWDLALQARAAAFHTDSYDSRVYMFENDLRGVMSNTGYYGSGMRLYLLVSAQLADGVAVTAKYGRTIRNDATSIGSGDDLIPTDAVGKLAAQLDVRL